MNTTNFLVYPGIKIGENQNYTITYNYQTAFVVHREAEDEILFTSNDLGEYERLEIEILLREHLTNVN